MRPNCCSARSARDRTANGSRHRWAPRRQCGNRRKSCTAQRQSAKGLIRAGVSGRSRPAAGARRDGRCRRRSRGPCSRRAPPGPDACSGCRDAPSGAEASGRGWSVPRWSVWSMVMGFSYPRLSDSVGATTTDCASTRGTRYAKGHQGAGETPCTGPRHPWHRTGGATGTGDAHGLVQFPSRYEWYSGAPTYWLLP